MRTLLVFFTTFCFVISSAQAQKNQNTKLSLKIQELVKGFNGQVGIYVLNRKTGETAEINADTVFPTASMIKVPIMCGVFDKIEKGELKYNQEMVYRDSLGGKYYGDEDIVGFFKDSTKIRLSKLQMLSITTSDNTASVWLEKLVGGENINQWLAANGFSDTRVNSFVQGREGFRKKYGWGQTTPREMSNLLVMIGEGKAVSRAASERMYRNLGHIYWDDKALSQIPPFVQTASKQGAVDQSRSEAVCVNAPHGTYVFCIITKNQKDTSWTSENEGFHLIVSLSKLLWNYFEPNSHWEPSPGIEKYEL